MKIIRIEWLHIVGREREGEGVFREVDGPDGNSQ